MSQKLRPLYPELSVLENLNLYSGLYGLEGAEKKRRIDEMIELAGLVGRENEPTSSLSGGWRQRLALGCAILHKPKILCLDGRENERRSEPKARLPSGTSSTTSHNEGPPPVYGAARPLRGDEAPKHCDEAALAARRGG